MCTLCSQHFEYKSNIYSEMLHHRGASLSKQHTAGFKSAQSDLTLSKYEWCSYLFIQLQGVTTATQAWAKLHHRNNGLNLCHV